MYRYYWVINDWENCLLLLFTFLYLADDLFFLIHNENMRENERKVQHHNRLRIYIIKCPNTLSFKILHDLAHLFSQWYPILSPFAYSLIHTPNNLLFFKCFVFLPPHLFSYCFLYLTFSVPKLLLFKFDLAWVTWDIDTETNF